MQCLLCACLLSFSSRSIELEKEINSAGREFGSAVGCLEDSDYASSLKYLQECMDAVEAVLMAYGIDYPEIHAVGHFLYEIEEK